MDYSELIACLRHNCGHRSLAICTSEREEAADAIVALKIRVTDLTADILEDGKLRKIAYDQRDKAEADLAAARALLLEARMRIWHTCGAEGESKCLSHRIDAALAGEKK